MFKTLLAATAIAAVTLPAQAVTVVQWDFEAVTAPMGTSTSFNGIASSTGTGTASSVHAAPATYSTVAGNGSSKSVSSNGWAVGDFWQFSFSTVGYSGVSLSFDQAGSNTGPRDFTLAYSTGGGAYTSVGSYTVALSTFGSNSYNSAFTFTYDLSAISALNNQSTLAFRLVDATTTSINAGTVAAGGTDRVDNFTVLAAPVPEPGTYALLLAGLGALGFIARRRV